MAKELSHKKFNDFQGHIFTSKSEKYLDLLSI